MLNETTDIGTKLSEELRKKRESVVLALDNVEGMDHHDLSRHLADALHSDVKTIRAGLVRVWLAQGSNRDQAAKFISELRGAIDAMSRV